MTVQTEIISLENLVPTNHIYRKFIQLIDLEKITNKHLTRIVSNSINILFKALLLQHLEAISNKPNLGLYQHHKAYKAL
jgi:hypothetical protein